jgi:hypothetical protein
MRLPLQKNVHQGLKKLADIQEGPVLWGSDLEKFHCIWKLRCLSLLEGVKQFSSLKLYFHKISSWNIIEKIHQSLQKKMHSQSSNVPGI